MNGKESQELEKDQVNKLYVALFKARYLTEVGKFEAGQACLAQF